MSCLFNGRDTVISNLDLCDGRLRYARGATAHLRPRHPSVRDDTDSAVAHRGTAPLDARDVTSRRPRPSETLRGSPRVATFARANIVHEPARGRSAPRAWYATAAVARARSTIAVKNQLADADSLGTIGHPSRNKRRGIGVSPRPAVEHRPTDREMSGKNSRTINVPTARRAAHAVATSGDGRRTRWVRRSARGERDAWRRGGRGAVPERARGVSRGLVSSALPTR